MSYSFSLFFIIVFSSLFSSLSLSIVHPKAAQDFQIKPHPAFIQGQVLVKVDPNQSTGSLIALENNIKSKPSYNFSIVPGLRLYHFDPSVDVLEVVRLFKAHKVVVYAEPNYIYQAAVDDINDPDFSKLWGLENRAQTGGKADADINSILMWTHQRGSKNIVIGIIDTGMDYTHPDLIGNVWANPSEIKDNGKDDDQNGYIDDIHGVNAIKNNGNPMDDNMHGTHVAGTIGAVGNNSQGISGVTQSVQMISCKFLSSGGAGTTSNALKCLEYFALLKSRPTNPVNIVATNNSWGGGGRSQALLDAIRAHEKLGILFVAAAGNESANNDITDTYPANYDVSNIVSVAATDHNDRLATFSNYGRRKVHVAAPGVKIWSTVLGHSYGELSGTSMATPHVTGLIAIIASQFTNLSSHGIKNLLLTGGQKIAATINATISGRRIRGADENGVGSLTCDNQTLAIRNEPTAGTHTIQLGQSIRLSAQHLNCASTAGPLTVYNGPHGHIILEDTGEHGDTAANDGIYSLNWTPTLAGDYQLRFLDNDLVNVTVFGKNGSRSYVADTSVAYDYTPIGGKRLHASDETMHQVKAPFPIRFGGDQNEFIDLYIGSNGTVSFTDRMQLGPVNQHLPTTKANTLITPFWDNLTMTDGASDIYIETKGVAPERVFIVEWWKVKHVDASGLGSFQVIFYENSSDFRFNYLDTDFSNPAIDHGASATVGVQLGSEFAGEYSFETQKIASASSILWRLH